MKSNQVRDLRAKPSIGLVDSDHKRLRTLGDHVINIADKNCVAVDFCQLYCSQTEEPFKEFEFLKPYESELDQSVFLVDLAFAPYIEYPDFVAYRDLLRSRYPQAVFVTGDFRYRNNPAYVFYSGIFYYQYTRWKNLLPEALAMSEIYERDYIVSCLNRRPLNHRAYLITKLYHAGMINNKNYITFFNKDPYTNQPITANDYYVDQLPEAVRQQFVDLIPLLPFNHESDYDGTNDVSFDHPAFGNSYLNIVTESEVECRWFSEKVMKPLATGQMFLLAAGQYAVNDLRTLGFDVFDDIVDHNRYDLLESWHDRVSVIADLAQEYQSRDWAKIYSDTLERRQQNIRLFFSEEFQNNIRKNIKAVVQST